jgi:hypothetical protein
MCKFCYDNNLDFVKSKKATKCAHSEESNYAKGLCKACYKKNINVRKQEKVVSCGHNTRPYFSRGMCNSCYNDVRAVERNCGIKLKKNITLTSYQQFNQLVQPKGFISEKNQGISGPPPENPLSQLQHV